MKKKGSGHRQGKSLRMLSVFESDSLFGVLSS